MTSDKATTQEYFQRNHTLALQGDKEAQYWTADCYHRGHGVDLNAKKAFQFYQRAADQESGKAMYKLGYCYLNDYVTKKNCKQAQRLWRDSIPLLKQEAEELNDPESMFLLSDALRRGVEEEDPQQAVHWTLRAAAEHEHVRSQAWLANAYENGLCLLEPNDRHAIKWLHRAAENGHGDSQFRLGQNYCYGIRGAPSRDWVKALYWYQKAKENGHFRDAQSCIFDLKREIKVNQALWEGLVKETLAKTIHCSLPFMSLWPHGLEKLASPPHQPAGLSPIFLAVKALIPHLSSKGSEPSRIGPKPQHKKKRRRRRRGH